MYIGFMVYRRCECKERILLFLVMQESACTIFRSKHSVSVWFAGQRLFCTFFRDSHSLQFLHLVIAACFITFTSFSIPVISHTEHTAFDLSSAPYAILPTGTFTLPQSVFNSSREIHLSCSRINAAVLFQAGASTPQGAGMAFWLRLFNDGVEV